MSSVSSVTDWSTRLGVFVGFFLPKNMWRYLPIAAAWETLEYQSLLPNRHGRAELHNQSSHGFYCLFSRIFKE